MGFNFDLSVSYKYINKTKESITDLAVKESGIKVVPKDTVIMSFKLSLGKTSITTEDIYTNEAIMAFIDKKIYPIYNDFIYYVLKNNNWMEDTNKAVMGATLNKTTLTNIKFSLPPIDVQKYIADILDKTQEIINLYKKQLEELDNLIKATFYDMFGDPAMNERGWEIIRLQDMIYKLGDGLHGTPIYSENGEYNFINGNNLEDGRIIITNSTKKVDRQEFEKYKKELNKESMLVSINGTLGRVAFYSDEKVILGKSTCYINLKDIINKKYLYYIFKSEYFIKYAFDVATGSTIKNVSLKSMRNFPVPYPDLDLQNKFAQIVTNIEEQKAIVKQSLSQSQNLFNSLMSKYFD